MQSQNTSDFDRLWIAAGQKTREREYWTNRFAGALNPGSFPTLYNPVHKDSGAFAALEFEMGAEMSRNLLKWANHSDVRLFIVLTALVSLLLSKYSGSNDVTLGVPVAKNGAGEELLNKVLAIRNNIDPLLNFKEFLMDVRQTIMAADEMRNYPLEVLVKELGLPVQGNESPLFKTGILLENIHLRGDFNRLQPNVVFVFKSREELISGRVEYRSRLYDRQGMMNLLGHFKEMAGQILAEPDKKLKHISLLSQKEKDQLLVDFNRVGQDYPTDLTIHGLFQAQAEKNPGSPALTTPPKDHRDKQKIQTEQTGLTYKELDEASTRLANIIRDRGGTNGRIVAILAQRSMEMILGLLAILKAGCAYLPLNPKNPASRNRFMILDCSVDILLYTPGVEAQARELAPGNLLAVDETLFKGEVKPLIMQNESSWPAYVIYTSGSTGNPKGVAIAHENICPLLHWGYKELAIQDHDRVIQNLSYYFDWSVWEIFITLTSGACLYMIDDEILLDPKAETEFINTQGITVLHITPTQFQYLLNQGKRFETLRYLCLGAEKLNLDLAERALDIVSDSCRVFNMYGPTEATIISAVLELERERMASFAILKSVPIGKTLGNNRLFVLDSDFQPLPTGVTGELFISGPGLASGYINNPELTSEVFVKVQGHEYFYRTGDLARFLPDGCVEFVGRRDHQVKVRGFRIEPGEIERVLLEKTFVTDALVMARPYKSGENYLCAYLVVDPKKQLAEAEGAFDFRAYLSDCLPAYMVPAHFYVLEKMPLNPNGKVDLKALPVPAPGTASIPYQAPGNELQEKLLDIWTRVLLGSNRDSDSPVEDLESVTMGINHNFFEMGGHSLKATTLAQLIYKELEVNLDIEDIFRLPTVRELADHISEMRSRGGEKYIAISKASQQDDYPLSFAQRRLWVLCQFEEDSTAYNMPAAMVLSGPLDVKIFKKAVQSLVDRHESFRTLFIKRDGEPRQKIISNLQAPVEWVKLDTPDPSDRVDKAREIYLQCANSAFDLEQGPLFKFMLLEIEKNRHVLVYNMHHIVNDGWSQGIIYNDLISLYNTYLHGEKVLLPPVEISYKDYTLWHNQLIESGNFSGSGSYWLEKFKDKPNGIELPLDRPRKAIQTFNGGRVAFMIDKEILANLTALALKEDATIFMSLLALLNILLYKYTGGEDIILGAPIANRKQPELHHLVGFLVNTLVYRNRIEPGENFLRHLRSVKNEALECYRYQDYPFDLLIEKLQLERDLSQSPLFNVMIAHNNAETEDSRLKMEGIEQKPFPGAGDFNMSKFDLTYFFDEVETGVQVRIEFNSDLFDRSTIEAMARNFQVLIGRVIENPGLPVNEINILEAKEYNLVTKEFNNNSYAFQEKSLVRLFEDQAQKDPGKIAIQGLNGKMSYGDLNTRANRLSHHLSRVYHIQRNHIIGVSMERSIEMIVVLLAIMKAGAAYLAVDPNYPRERVMHVLGDSKTKVLIADRMREDLYSGFQGKLLESGQLESGATGEAKENPCIENQPKDMLYINYTSGSTGTPNGAMLSHGCLTNLIHWQNTLSGVDCSLRVLQFTSINFCVSFQEIMGTLTSGGELHLIGDIQRQDIDYLMNFLMEKKIQVLFLPFSYLNFLFNESDSWDQNFSHDLKHIVTAGEQLKITRGLKKFLDENPHIQLHNHYGSTEMHVVTSFTLDASSAGDFPIPPAGKPVANVDIFILDENFKPTPLGVYGELCVAGSEEILGYINNKKLTAEKLVYCPGLSPVRLYRSGDMGRWLPDGNIELRGRRDFMVKVRGFRVEPGEIESKILSMAGVKECVVVVKDDKKGQKYLVAYLSVTGTDQGEIKNALFNELPQYMIPRLIILEALPLMPNGKVDRDKLPEPGPDLIGERRVVEPDNPEETGLREIWSQLLDMDETLISVEDNFFELGGHSLKATTMSSLIHQSFNVKIDLIEIFKNPTIRNIATLIKVINWTFQEDENPEEGDEGIIII